MSNKKIELHLVADPFNVDALVKLIKNLTGRDPTPEEIAEAKAILAQIETDDPGAQHKDGVLRETRGAIMADQLDECPQQNSRASHGHDSDFRLLV